MKNTDKINILRSIDKKFSINLNNYEIQQIKLNALKQTKNFTIFRHFLNLDKILN